MRLFGTPGAGLNKARSTYGFLPPFDLALSAPVVVTPQAIINLFGSSSNVIALEGSFSNVIALEGSSSNVIAVKGSL